MFRRRFINFRSREVRACWFRHLSSLLSFVKQDAQQPFLSGRQWRGNLPPFRVAGGHRGFESTSILTDHSFRSGRQIYHRLMFHLGPGESARQLIGKRRSQFVFKFSNPFLLRLRLGIRRLRHFSRRYLRYIHLSRRRGQPA